MSKQNKIMAVVAIVIMGLLIVSVAIFRILSSISPAIPETPTITLTPTHTSTSASPMEVLSTNTPAPTNTLAPTYTPSPEDVPGETPTPVALTLTPISPTTPITPSLPNPVGDITSGFSLTMTRIISLTDMGNITPTEYSDLLWDDERLAFEEEQRGIKQYDLYKVGYPLVFCTKAEADTGTIEIELLNEDGNVMGSYFNESIRFACRVLGSSPDWGKRPIFAKVTPTKGEGFSTDNLLWTAKVWRVEDVKERDWGVVEGIGDAVFLPFNTQSAWGYYDIVGDTEVEILYLCNEGVRQANTRSRIPFTLPNECYGLELHSAGEWFLLLNKGNNNAEETTPTATTAP
jgi:hypothetical protein